MGIIRDEKERLIEVERENRLLRAQLSRSNAIIEYIGACDYPEIFEEVEEVEENGDEE